MTRLRIAAVVMALIALGSAACGGWRHPSAAQLSPEGQAAVYGRQVVAGLNSAATTIDLLIDSKAISKEDGVAALQGLLVASQEAKRLADALAIIDKTKDRVALANGKAKIVEVVRALQQAVAKVVIPVGTEQGRQKVLALMEPITNVLLSLLTVIPMGEEQPADVAVAWWPSAAWQPA